MPAEAELLCDYFLSSKLNTKKKKFVEPISAAAVLLKTQQNSTSNFSTKDHSFDSIEFVKYEKNPMDYLKSKYTLMNGSTNATGQENGHKLMAELQKPVEQANTSEGNKTVKKVVESSLNMNWSKVKRNGIGLLNIGNNCYLNATLQCLAYTAPFSQWLLTRPHSPSCGLKRQKGFCSMCDVERIIGDIFSSNGCAKPNSLCMNIRKISTVFGVGRQEDASEFFTTLLESMSKAINLQNNPNQNNKQNKTEANRKRPSTLLDEIFSFQFRSRVTCCSCGRVSDTIENNNTWPVDVKHNTDIRKGMLQFMREDILDGHNAYKCDNCHKKTRATKRYSIRKSPNILVVHLKRFDFSVNGKLSHHVSYPELLNLKNLTQNPTLSTSKDDTKKGDMKNSIYKLYGVLVHLGHTSRSGHYYSYVKGPNETWFRADDSRVNKVQATEALNQKAYMLFYKRVVPDLVEAKDRSSNPSLVVAATPSLNGHATESKFDINARSPFFKAPAEVPVVVPVNGEKVERATVGSNILNNLITSKLNVVKEKTNGYSYSKPVKSLTNGTNGFHSPKENGTNGFHHPKEIDDEKSLEKNGHMENGAEKDGLLEKKKLSKKAKVRRLTVRIVELKESSADSKKKPIKLKKLIKRRKALRQQIQAQKQKKSATPPDLSSSKLVATTPAFSKVTACMGEPLKLEVAKTFATPAENEDVANVFKALKTAAATSSLRTWDNEVSKLLVTNDKKKAQNGRKRNHYDGLDGIEVDSDEYNEDFDKPQIREKKSKLFMEQKRSENGFHKFTHDLAGGAKKFVKSFHNGDKFSSQKGAHNRHRDEDGGNGHNGKSNFNNRHKPYGR